MASRGPNGFAGAGAVHGCLLPPLHLNAVGPSAPARLGARLDLELGGRPLYVAYPHGDRETRNGQTAPLMAGEAAWPEGPRARTIPPLPAIRITATGFTRYAQLEAAAAERLRADGLQRAHAWDLWTYAADGRLDAVFWTVEVASASGPGRPLSRRRASERRPACLRPLTG
jgi:hypothetical protein